MMSELKSNRAQGRRRGPSRRWRDTSRWETPGVYYADLTLGGRPITVKLCGRSRTSKGRQGPGTPLLEEGEASGLPLDLHHQQRRQGAVGELDLRSVEAFLKF